MRRLGGLALIALGVFSVLVGCVAAIAFGPDNRWGTGPHRLSSIGPAIVTAPEALAYAGPEVELTATSAERDRALFIGVGHDVDVRDFLAETPRTRINAISIPWKITTSRVPGSGSPKGAPDAVDWWIAEARGPSPVVLTWRLPDVAADVVILAIDGRGPLTVDITASIVVPGIFVVGLALVVIGLGTAVFGWAVRTTRADPRGSHAHRPQRTRLVVGLVGVTLLVTACAIPYRRDTEIVTKVGATAVSARSVVATYNAVRQRADERLDGSLLADVEGGDLLDIDQGAYFVSVRVDAPGGYQGVHLRPPERVISPRFADYPLWFVVVARDPGRDTKRVAVFERADSVSPWLMTTAPETSATAALPLVVHDSTGAAVTVGPQDDTAIGVTPTAVLDRYAEALSPEGDAAAESFAPDAFLTQTRRFQKTQQSLPFATFTQTWTADPPDFALRCRGGGVLVFGTLSRVDSYSVETDSFIDWADNAEAAAYLPGRVYRSASLDYTHQLLMFIPPEGRGKPRLVGQYGGVVDGQGS